MRKGGRAKGGRDGRVGGAVPARHQDAPDGIGRVKCALSELIVNVNANANGFAQFCDNTGCFGTLLALSQNGSNFFDVHFNPSADFLTINSFLHSNATDASQLIADTRQWRVAAGDAPVAVPEPASLAVLGAGLFVMGWYLRRRKDGCAPEFGRKAYLG